MNAELLFSESHDVKTPLLTVFAVDIAPGKDATPSPALMTTSDPLSRSAAHWLGSGEFKAALGESLLLHSPAGVDAERVLVVGLGKVKSLSPHALRKAAGAAVRFAKPRGIRNLAIKFPNERALADEPENPLPVELSARALVEGAYIADFEIDTYRSDRKDTSIESLTFVSSERGRTHRAEVQRGFEAGRIVGESQNFARALVNEPGNVLTPTELGKRAAAMAEEVGLHCDVSSTQMLEHLGMGAFLAVAKGSYEPPALIVLRYEPPTPAPANAPVLGLVGKGITFDTGGISLKPADGMDKMKYDMGGAAAMLGAMRAIALLKPNVRVVSVICSCENMPSGRAYRPGDVLKAMSGTTIEVLNTDAEGRLVLADGLHYAKTLGATHLINAATLTGAIGVALGQLNAGLFSNDDEAVIHFQRGLETSGEGFWRMPCTDEYRDTIKSSIGDIMNTGGSRYGGAISAAMFLKEFVGDTPWLHLDIANMAWIDDNKPWISKGPSGVGVRSILEWVRTYAS
ncbi:leucyl aminopeptidase [Granulicella cerasi]|uniref:Probable cytosol aminopeptidase n=1 Tax=Granulicella cerasi TaxID=741063 RepID=A0ABW1ZFD5_9BACT|nr:leucyl aminopeptidase [Granulicella cerasi]